jgi:fibronectin type 3 domain-containing protein
MSIKTAGIVGLFALGACSGLDLDRNEQAVSVPPSNITATATGPHAIDLTWSTVAGARSYYVLQSQGGGPFNYVATVVDPGASYTASGLTPSTAYSFQLVTIDGFDGVESAPSAAVTATTLAVDAFAPTNLVATPASATSIDLTWNAVPNAVKYYVYMAQGVGPFSYFATVLAPGTSVTAIGLTPNTSYSFQVTSGLTDNTETPPSAVATATTQSPAVATPPTGVTAFAFSESRISVQWQPATPAAKYFVYQSQAGGPFTFAASLTADSTSYLFANLAADTTYCYQVTTVLADDTESAPSTPPACDTTLSPGSGGFEGWWKFDERTGTTAVDQSGFGRNASLVGGAGYSTTDRPPIDDDRSALAISASSTSAATVPAAFGLGLFGSFSVVFWAKVPTAGNAHFIGMRAPGCGAVGWEIADTTVNSLHFAGEGGQIIPFGTTLAADTWTHIGATYSGGTMRLYINGAQVASAPYAPGSTLPGSLDMGHVAGCTGGAVSLDEVRIYGRELTASELASLGTVPPAPTNLVISSQLSVAMNLTWTAAPGATAHIIEKGTASGNELFYTHSPATPTFQGDHLTPNTQYSWRVRTVAHGLYSAPSNEVIGTTDPAPAAPTGVTATVVLPDRIQVSWNAVANVFKYYVFESVNGGPFNFRGSVVSPATSLVVANLSSGSTYTYQVQAEDFGQVVSPMSASASATIP